MCNYIARYIQESIHSRTTMKAKYMSCEVVTIRNTLHNDISGSNSLHVKKMYRQNIFHSNVIRYCENGQSFKNLYFL